MSSKEDKLKLLEAIQEKERRLKENKLAYIFPSTGLFARQYYEKHLEFFRAGAEYKERALIGGNRVGKTFSGSAECAYHLTGLYPEWWEGRRFNHPINMIAAGDTSKSTRDIIQYNLIGPKIDLGTGMIPKYDKNGKERIVKATTKVGTPEAVEQAWIRHENGGLSRITFVSYEQGRKSFQGTSEHLIWMDEEPDDPQIYSEAVTRTATTEGSVICTFTPLSGISDIVLAYMPGAIMPENHAADKFKWATQIGWEDVPLAQVPQVQRDAILASCLPYEREARSKGIPCIGAGKIYPISEDDVLVDSFAVPKNWLKGYGLDPGYSATAACFFAINPQTNTVYLYDEYIRTGGEPASHAAAIKARGDWLIGAMDYAGPIRDGANIVQQHLLQGLKVVNADKSVDAGLLICYRAMCEGRLKVMRHCTNWLKEFRVYHRDDRGHIVKKNDHLMDAMRYFMMTGINLVRQAPEFDTFYKETNEPYSPTSTIGGY